MKKGNKIRINQGRILRWEIRVLFSIAIFYIMFFSLFRLEEFQAIMMIIFLSGPFIALWYGYYFVEIDLDQKVFRLGYWVTGFQGSKSKTYTKLGAFNIRSSSESEQQQKIWSGMARKSYLAFLSYNETDEIYLFGGNSKPIVEEMIRKISKKIMK